MDNKALVPTNSFDLMDRADEQLVLDEIKGRAMDALVYEIHQQGRAVTGLSLAGVRETVRVMNSKGIARIGITDMIPVVTETEEYVEVKAYAQDQRNGGGYWGIKRQSKAYSNGDPNTFALEQALAKAQRNALRGLIPEWFVKEMIDAFRKQGKTKVVEAGNGHVQPPPEPGQEREEQPRRAPPISNNQRNKLIELYRERFGGTEDEITQGLDAVFEASFHHGMGSATLAEASNIISKMIASKSGGAGAAK